MAVAQGNFTYARNVSLNYKNHTSHENNKTDNFADSINGS